MMNDGLETIVTIEHVRKAGVCTRGARAWAARHGFDYRRFLLHGYPADEIEAIGDALALKVVAIARAAASNQGDKR